MDTETKNFIVYRASAGSGKTYTLVREYLRLALDYKSPRYFKHILAITFTNKAAAELKARVLKTIFILGQGPQHEDFDDGLSRSLSAEIGIDPSELHERAAGVWKAMLHNYHELAISTIDSFVYRLLRVFAVDLKLDGDFEVEIDTAYLMERSVDDLLTQIGIDPTTTRQLTTYMKTKLSEEKSWNIREQLIQDIRGIEKEQAQLLLPELGQISHDQWQQAKKDLEQGITDFENSMQALALGELQRFRHLGLEDNDFKAGYLPNFWQGAIDNACKPTTPALEKRMADDIVEWMKKKPEDHVHAAFETHQEELRQGFFGYKSRLEGEQGQLYELRKILLKQWNSIKVLTSLDYSLEQLKAEEGSVLISDFNRAIFNIVRDNPAPFIFERLGEWYHHFLFDEFQDTSIMQWQNFLPLLDNSLSKGKRSYVVGDSKQAIYRFRNGEVRQFANLPDVFEPLSETLGEYEESLARNYAGKTLGKNWRSAPAVVEFNNQFYKHLNSVNETLNDYYSEDLKQDPARDFQGYVEVTEVQGEKADEQREAMARETLVRIREALEDGFSIDDIAVLVRKTRDLLFIAEAVMEEGYGVITEQSLRLSRHTGVLLIVAFARVLQEPRSESAKAQLLSCLSILRPDKYPHTETFIKAIQFREKRRFINLSPWMGKWQKQAELDSYTMYELAEWVVATFDLFDSGKAFIDTLLNQIVSLGSSSQVDFLEWWDVKGQHMSLDSSGATGGVRLMTIHKSKGLEFPVVIFPQRPNQIKNLDVWLQERKDVSSIETFPLRVGFAKAKKLGGKLEEEHANLMLEETNLVYVATTRAEERLYWLVVGEENPDLLLGMVKTALAQCDSSWSTDGQIIRGQQVAREARTFESIKSQWDFPSHPIRNNPNIRLEKRKENLISEEREFGNRVHELLSIHDDALRELKMNRMANDISPEEISRVKDHVNKVMSSAQIKQWEDLPSLNERDLVDENGKLLRPDRVVLTEEGIDVIDYKTGQREKSHNKQVSTYMDLLQRIENIPVRGFLFYTDTLELVEVDGTE